MRMSVKADIALTIATALWGISGLLIQVALLRIQEFNLIALRFIIAFIVSSVVFKHKVTSITKKTVKSAAVLGIILLIVFVLVTFGLKYTTAANAGFLMGLSSIFVPVILFVLFKQKFERNILICLCMAITGIIIFFLDGGYWFNPGDFLCLLSAIFYAVYIIAVEKITKNGDEFLLVIIQFAFIGIYATIFSFIFESPMIPDTFTSWMAIIGLSVFCTSASFIIQIVAQKYTTSIHAGMIFTIQPVFTAVFAFICIGEVLSIWKYIGGGIMLFSILLLEILTKFKFQNEVTLNE